MLTHNSILHDNYLISYVVDEHPDCVVYRATDQRENHRVLIAELLQLDAETLEDTRHLADHIANIQVAGLLPLRDYFAEALRFYMVVDDPGSEDLERVIHQQSSRQAEHIVLEQIERLLAVFAVLHDQQPQLLVSDLRSTDVWPGSDNAFYLAPFVLARPFGAEPSPYRAPDLGNPNDKPTTSSDLYALGAVCYKLLTGQAPLPAQDRIDGVPLPEPRSFNPQISALTEQMVLRSLDLKPANRYQSAREMRRALDIVRLMEGRSLGLATPPTHHPDLPGPGETVSIAQPVPPVPSGARVEPPAIPAPATPTIPPALPPGTIMSNYDAQAVPATHGSASSPAAKPNNTCLFVIVGILAFMAMSMCIVAVLLLTGSGSTMLRSLSVLPSDSSQLPSNESSAQSGQQERGTARIAGSSMLPTTGPTPSVDPQAISLATIETITETRQISESLLGPIHYTPDGQFLAIGDGATIQIHTTTSLELVQTLEGHTGQVATFAFTPSSTERDPILLASGATDEATIRIWNIRTGQEVQQLNGHTGWIRSLAFSPDGTLIASGSTDKTIKMWDVQRGELVRTMEGHTDWIGDITFSPDGSLLASTGRDGTLRLWEVDSGAQRRDFSFTAPVDPNRDAPYWLTGLAFSPDGRRIAVGSTESNVRIFDVRRGRVLRTLEGHTGWVVLRGVAFSPDGETLASASLDGSIRLWNAETGAERGTLEGRGLRIQGLSWHPNGEQLASGSDDNAEVLIWNVDSGEVAQSFRTGQGLVTSLTYSLDGSILATGSVNGTMRLHLLAENQQLMLLGSSPNSQSIAFASETKIVAVSDVGSVIMFDPTGTQTSQVLEGLGGPAFSMAVSPDRSLIAAGTNNGKIVVWNAKDDGRQLYTLTDLNDSILALTFSSDNRRLIAVSTDDDNNSRIGIWDASDGTRKHVLTEQDSPITGLAVQPGGQTLASISRAGTLQLWDIATGEVIRMVRTPAEQGWFTSVAFSPDGSLITTGSLEGTIEFWSTTTGESVHRHSFGQTTVLALAFRRDGQQLAVSLSDGSVRLLGIQR